MVEGNFCHKEWYTYLFNVNETLEKFFKSGSGCLLWNQTFWLIGFYNNVK